MPSSDWYLAQFAALDDLERFLVAHSGLPGPRANLELVYAFAAWGDEALFLAYLASIPDGTDSNDPAIYPALCAIVGLGRVLGEGSDAHWERLRLLASDPRWRVREAVAMALQQAGRVRFLGVLEHTLAWRTGDPLEQRAVVAGICEPALLQNPDYARVTLAVLDEMTRSLVARPDRRGADVRVLRQALGYAWSVAVAALPGEGWGMLERWSANADPDVRWIMRENLRKKRLQRAHPEGTAALLADLAGGRTA